MRRHHFIVIAIAIVVAVIFWLIPRRANPPHVDQPPVKGAAPSEPRGDQ